MTRRYYCEGLPASGGIVSLSKEESGHAIRVMRAQVGDSVELFDGHGHQATGAIVSLGRNDCVCEIGEPEFLSRMPAAAITMAVAMPKADRAREMIERLTELGVQTVVPIVAERTQRPPSDSAIAKWRRAVVEACKQSRRNELMTIESPVSWCDFLANLPVATEATGKRLIAHPMNARSGWISDCHQDVCVGVGPEGGWTDCEVELALAVGFEPISLGNRIYRIETAASAIASVWVTAGLSSEIRR